MFTNTILNNGYGVETYSVESLKSYVRYSKEIFFQNISIQEELFSFEFQYKPWNHAVTAVKSLGFIKFSFRERPKGRTLLIHM